VVAAATFGIATALEPRDHWLGWVQAAALASLVGGLADWFAVVALFRRPLGLPLPHTAIVVERKDRFAETLGGFVQENFLSYSAVIERLRSSQALARAARWMSEPDNAAELAGRVAGALVTGAELVRDEDVQATFESLLRDRLRAIGLAPLAGRALDGLTRGGRHQPLLDSTLDSLARWLSIHGADLHHRLGTRSPWWLPGPIDRSLVDRLLRRSQSVVADMASDRAHPLRRRLDAALQELAAQLQTSERWRRRGEELEADLLTQPAVRQFATEVWTDLKAAIAKQAADPDSMLRARLSTATVEVGKRLLDDPTLALSAERGLEAAVRLLVDKFEPDLAALVSGTIERWDAVDTSRRLELLLGPDLQYIRINGTVVGALALHAVAVFS
jgi:uncharacterized membrane-anchored protein YjiN (DUF445 family)